MKISIVSVLVVFVYLVVLGMIIVQPSIIFFNGIVVGFGLSFVIIFVYSKYSNATNESLTDIVEE